MSSRRIAQVNELLRHEIGAWLSRFFEPPRRSVITIEEIITSADLGHAKVLISILPQENGKDVLRALESCARELRRHLMKRLTMKFIPMLHFVQDDREARAEHIHRLLDAGA